MNAGINPKNKILFKFMNKDACAEQYSLKNTDQMQKLTGNSLISGTTSKALTNFQYYDNV
jgi:hypothetical protein